MRYVPVVCASLAYFAQAYVPPALPSTTRLQAAVLDAELSPLNKKGELKQPLSYRVADKVVGTLFGIEPVFDLLSKKARSTMVKRASKIGVSWEGLVDDLKRNFEEVEKEYEAVNRERVIMPDYYVKPFHAYKEGNLCWDAAMEVEAAAFSVHSPIYTDNKALEREGDAKLRGYFHDRMMDVLVNRGFKPKTIVDIGCSTGLSTLKLQSTFPEAEVLGLDLSPYMLAVAKYNLRTRPEQRQAQGRIDYVHAAGEATGMPDEFVDMVSVCLVNHELPVSGTRNLFREAHRILKPGGVLTFMDMDPEAPAFQRIVNNPMLFALFKSTEPWLQDYVSLELIKELREAGFKDIEVRSNSPRHRTVVAVVDK